MKEALAQWRRVQNDSGENATTFFSRNRLVDVCVERRIFFVAAKDISWSAAMSLLSLRKLLFFSGNQRAVAAPEADEGGSEEAGAREGDAAHDAAVP